MEKLFRQKEPPSGDGVLCTGRVSPVSRRRSYLAPAEAERDGFFFGRIRVWPQARKSRVFWRSEENRINFESAENVDSGKVLARVHLSLCGNTGKEIARSMNMFQAHHSRIARSSEGSPSSSPPPMAATTAAASGAALNTSTDSNLDDDPNSVSFYSKAHFSTHCQAGGNIHLPRLLGSREEDGDGSYVTNFSKVHNPCSIGPWSASGKEAAFSSLHALFCFLFFFFVSCSCSMTGSSSCPCFLLRKRLACPASERSTTTHTQATNEQTDVRERFTAGGSRMAPQGCQWLCFFVVAFCSLKIDWKTEKCNCWSGDVCGFKLS